MELRGTKPNLIIIGARKCGTTSLHHYLDAHPEISMAPTKETNHFLDHPDHDRGADWYGRQFDPAAPVRGEASPYYTDLPASEGTAERIRAALPGVKLIYMVRDPFERAISDYMHYRAVNLERRAFSQEMSDRSSPYAARGFYATQLKPYLKAFSADQILVQTQEDLLGARGETLRRIFAFLGVDESFQSDEFDRIWQASGGKGTGYSLVWRGAIRVQPLVEAVPRRIRWAGQRLLRSSLLGGSRARRPEFDSRLRLLWEDRFRAEADELRALTGLKLDNWSV